MGPAAVVPLLIASTVISTGGMIMQGAAQAAEARENKREAKRQGLREFAEATRLADIEKAKGEEFLSNARAQMAGSGGVTDDPGAIRMQGEIASVTDENFMQRIFEGQTGLNERKRQAAASGRRARNLNTATALSAAGTATSGAAKVAGA
jgi:vacuolar-type H+-ATPase subunit B/Vma2